MHPNIYKLLLSFFGKYKLRTFAKGEIIIRPENKKIFFLTKGAVRMFSKLNNSELTINIYKPFSLFPMSLILNNKQGSYIYSALFEVEGYFAPKINFRKFLKDHPSIILDLLKRIYIGLDGFFMRMETLLIGDAYLRVLTHLIIYTRRFGKNTKGKITFDFPLTHEHLGYQTGLARESVTREIKKLQDKGLIGYFGKKIFIYDLLKLEEESIAYKKITP